MKLRTTKEVLTFLDEIEEHMGPPRKPWWGIPIASPEYYRWLHKDSNLGYQLPPMAPNWFPKGRIRNGNGRE